jgi:hypothetical protein
MARSRRSTKGLPEVFLTPLTVLCPACDTTAHVYTGYFPHPFVNPVHKQGE